MLCRAIFRADLATAVCVFILSFGAAPSSFATDLEAGKRAFLVCSACHATRADAGPRLGPNLHGVLGRDVANVKNYAYSAALKAYGGKWSAQRLAAFLQAPQDVVKGTKMTYGGVKSASDRANLIAWLNTQSDTPLANIGLPKPGSIKKQTPVSYGVLKIAPGADKTFAYCTACHSERIVAQQGLTRSDWDELLAWMVEEQGMNQIADNDKNDVLDYLAKHYNTDRPNFPK